MRNICSLITVYKPDIDKLKQNIETILQYSSSVYLLFNSAIIPELHFDDRIIFIDNKKNIGISKAINKGISIANKDGYVYAVLFDQDSNLSKESFTMLFSEMVTNEKTKKIACIGPSLLVYGNILKVPNWAKNKIVIETADVYSVNNIITSGMIVNINVFINISGFDEHYPVDFCDFVFCWKCIYNGYVILQSKDVFIIHEVGYKSLKIFGLILHFHKPYRNYFFIRDTLNICFKLKETPFPIRVRYFLLLFVRMFLYIILQDQKLLRLKMYCFGFNDFFNKKRNFGSIAYILNADDLCQ